MVHNSSDGRRPSDVSDVSVNPGDNVLTVDWDQASYLAARSKSVVLLTRGVVMSHAVIPIERVIAVLGSVQQVFRKEIGVTVIVSAFTFISPVPSSMMAPASTQVTAGFGRAGESVVATTTSVFVAHSAVVSSGQPTVNIDGISWSIGFASSESSHVHYPILILNAFHLPISHIHSPALRETNQWVTARPGGSYSDRRFKAGLVSSKWLIYGTLVRVTLSFRTSFPTVRTHPPNSLWFGSVEPWMRFRPKQGTVYSSSDSRGSG